MNNRPTPLHSKWMVCEIPRDDLFSEDFGFKINTLLCNLAQSKILYIQREFYIFVDGNHGN
jgi:hypothetical protein